MSNKLYDGLKCFALVFPIFITLVLAIITIWNIPYAKQIGLTLSAIESFVAALVKIANDKYKKSKK